MSALRPNLVFIFSDQHRWDFMGYADNGRTFTPNLDRLGKAGTIFHHAYCPAPLCCPARAAIAAGRYGMNTGCFTNLHQLPPNTPGYVPQLRAAGYRTCAIGKTHMEIHAYDSDLTGETHRQFMDSLGWDEIQEVSGGMMFTTGIRCAYSEFLRRQGADAAVRDFYRHWHYFMDHGKPAAHPFAAHAWSLPPELQETSFLTRTACDWLAGYSRAQPYFLFLGFPGPHSPTEPNPDFVKLYAGETETRPWGEAPLADWTLAARQGYRAYISQIDHAVGQVLAAVEARGELENTIFVYSSDHGEMAGDHGRFDKTCFYEGSLRVPLVIAGPGVQAGQNSRALVETLDLGRTLCEMTGTPAHDLDQGRSLVPLLNGRATSHRETIYTEMGCDKMLFDGRYKLMAGDPGSDTRRLGRLHLDKPVNIPPSPTRLYDLQTDPHERHDLAARAEAQPLLLQMQAKLLARINENTQARPCLSRGEFRGTDGRGS